MNVRPGRGLLRCLSAATVLSLLAFWFPPIGLVVVPILLITAVAAAREWRELRATEAIVAARLSAPATIGRDVAFPVSLTIHGPARLPIRIEARVEVPLLAIPNLFVETGLSLTADAPTAVRRRSFRIPCRGRHQIGPVWIRITGRWTLLERQLGFSLSQSIEVMPEQFWSAERLRKDSGAEERLLDQLTRSKRHGVGTEFESLAEFRMGDDPQRIDWRATARTRRLVVRRFQIEQHRDVFLVVDCGRLMGGDTGRGTKLDAAVDAALMLGRIALKSGDRTGIGAFDDQVRGYLPPIAGPQAMKILTKCLYDLQSQWRESDFSRMFAELQSRQRKRSLVVVLSDIVDDQTTTRFRSSLAALALRHVVVFAALRTPALTTTPREPIGTFLDAARHVVAYRLLHERERAIHSLRRSAVHVLDVEPAQLSVSLINQYVGLRRQNRL